MTDNIQQKFDSGDFSGATRELARQELKRAQDERLEAVFRQFAVRHPKFNVGDAQWMGGYFRKIGKDLNLVTLEDLESAWTEYTRDRRPVPVRVVKPQSTPAPAPPAPAPSTDDRLTVAAKALIQARGWTAHSIEKMGSHEFDVELRKSGRVFEVAVELLCPRSTQRPPTWGELQARDEQRALEHEREKQERLRVQLEQQSAQAAERNSEFALAANRERRRHLAPSIADQIPVRLNSERDAKILDAQLKKDREFLTGIYDEQAEKDVIQARKNRGGRGVR